MSITLARPKDAETVNRLFYEAAVWLHSRGLHQWDAVWPPAEPHQAAIRERIARGWCYLARCGSVHLVPA